MNEVQLQVLYVAVSGAKGSVLRGGVQGLHPPMRLVVWWHGEGRQGISLILTPSQWVKTLYRLVAQVEVKKVKALLERAPVEYL